MGLDSHGGNIGDNSAAGRTKKKSGGLIIY
jgi:hypothetical protein